MGNGRMNVERIREDMRGQGGENYIRSSGKRGDRGETKLFEITDMEKGWRMIMGRGNVMKERKQIDWARDEYWTDNNFITFVLIFFAVLFCPS